MSAKWGDFWDMCRPAPRAFTVPAEAMWHRYGSDENYQRIMSEARDANVKAQRQWFWTSDFGDIQLPADFPIEIFRKDGWWDMRFTALREKWEAWIAAEEAKLRGPIPEAPNRLHGAAINAEGDAI